MTALLIHESGFSIYLGVSYYMVIVTDSAFSSARGKQFHLPSYCGWNPLLVWVLLPYIIDYFSELLFDSSHVTLIVPCEFKYRLEAYPVLRELMV